MSENTLGHEGLDRDSLEPITSGQQFVADHFRFWQHDEGQTEPKHLPGLDELVILTDLPEHVEVDPDLRASVTPYPPLRSEVPLPDLSEVVEQVRSITDYPPKS